MCVRLVPVQGLIEAKIKGDGFIFIFIFFKEGGGFLKVFFFLNFKSSNLFFLVYVWIFKIML